VTLAVVVAALTCAASANAQTRYVNDELVITVRTGPSTANAIIRNLTTGDSVTVLEASADGDYQRVRTETGVEGWVLTQYLTDAPVARLRLGAAERNLTQARARVAELETTVASLTEQLANISQRAQEAEAAASNLNTELGDVRTASANALTIRDQNESLRRRLNERDLEVAELMTQNAALASRANREWFMLGAAVLVAGIVLGLIIPSLRRKRRTDW
jgi:SH3 domain protein